MRSSTHPRVLVTGAGGFVGHHLVTALKQRGYWVRGVDISPPEYTVGDADEFELRDLRRFDEHLQAEADVAPLKEGEFGLETRKDGIALRHVDGPQGARGRSSDNRRLREVLGWEPSVTLRQGLEPTYRWIEKQVLSQGPPVAAAGG
jgi:nucleoside-diphosphate-sugar epimerase